MNNESKKILTELKRSLAEKVPLYQIILFGSRARGDNASDSDMDVLVMLDAPVTREYRIPYLIVPGKQGSMQEL